MVLPQFKNSVADGSAVTEKSGFKAPQTNTQLRLSLLVEDGLKPLRKRFTAVFRLISEEFEHDWSVAYKLHPHK